MTLRIGLGTVLTAVAGLTIAGTPNGALAATTIGSNLAGSPTGGSLTCASGCTVSQSVLPPLSQAPGGVVAPNDGVVVRWRIKVGAATLPVALRITRPGSSDTRTGGGTGPTVAPPTNKTTAYDVRLPILAGDAIGLDCCADPSLSNSSNLFASTASATTLAWTPPLQDGGSPRLGTGTGTRELLINADIESDADHDGFGDETQDKCLGTPGNSNGCPSTLVLDSAKQKGTKPKVKVTATVPGAGTLQAGSANDASLASASASRSLKAVSQTISSSNQQQVTLTLKLTKSAKSKLTDTGKLKIKVKVVYTPPGGPAGSQTAKVKLKS